MTIDRAATIFLASVATIVGIVAFLFIPLSLVTGHPLNLVLETAILVLCVWYVARIMRGDRRARRAAEAALPPERRPPGRAPRSPVTFQVRETAVAFIIWYAVALAIGELGMGLPLGVNLGVALFAAFMLATLTVTGRHMMFRITGGDEDERVS